MAEDDIEDLQDELTERLHNSGAPEEVKEKLAKEINRYKAIPQMSAESGILLNYIETLLDIRGENHQMKTKILKKQSKYLKKTIISFLRSRIE